MARTYHTLAGDRILLIINCLVRALSSLNLLVTASAHVSETVTTHSLYNEDDHLARTLCDIALYDSPVRMGLASQACVHGQRVGLLRTIRRRLARCIAHVRRLLSMLLSHFDSYGFQLPVSPERAMEVRRFVRGIYNHVTQTRIDILSHFQHIPISGAGRECPSWDGIMLSLIDASLQRVRCSLCFRMPDLLPPATGLRIVHYDP